ncbi:MAG: outer membrane protein assembly factor BamA [Planctomycetota bacterium]
MTSIRLFTTALLFLAVLAFGMPAVADSSSAGRKIVEVEITGPDVVSAERLKLALKTRAGSDYDPDVADADIKSLFSRNLVEDVQLFVKEVEGGVKVIFHVIEKKLISDIKFRPAKSYYGAEEILEELLAKEGEYYSLAVSSQDEEIIADKYRSKGFLRVSVTHTVEAGPKGYVLVYEINQGQRFAVGEIEFTGNTVFSAKKLRSQMKTHRRDLFHGGSYIESDVQMDLEVLRRMYLDEGYLDAKVTLKPIVLPPTPKGHKEDRKLEFTMEIEIYEGIQYTVNSVDFSGETVFSKAELTEMLHIAPGETAKYANVMKSVQSIRDRFGELGRAFTDVQPEIVPTDDPNTVDIIFHIRQSDVVYVQEVIIQGNEVTREHVIRRELEIYPGEELTVKGIRTSLQNLQRLQYFNDVSISFEPRGDDYTDVVVSIGEGKTGNLLFGGGVSSDGDVFARVSYTERNFDISNWPTFRGGGQSMQLSASLGTSVTQFMLDFLEPHVFDSEYQFGFGAFRTVYERSTYEDTRVGGHVLVGKNLSKHLSVALLYTYQHVTIDELEPDAPASVVYDEGKHDLGSLTLRTTYRKLDDFYMPTSGWDVRGEFEYFSEFLASDYDFYKVTLKVSKYFNVYTSEEGSKHTLMARLNLGYMDETGDTEYIPTFERFYAGGINTVRGWQPREIGPREGEDPIGGYFRATATLEYSFPLYTDVLYFAVFFDAGSVWAEMDDFDANDLRYGTGAGIYLRTPLTPMPVRIYYTNALNEEEGEDTDSIQFSFGFMF